MKLLGYLAALRASTVTRLALHRRRSAGKIQSKTRSSPKPRTPVYLALDSIKVSRDLSSPELGRLASTTLCDALALPSVLELSGLEGRRLALQVYILDVGRGCHITRSSNLLSLLGFGNARLSLRAEVFDLDDELLLLRCTRFLRHGGLNRGADDYLRDNGADLIKELSIRAAYDLTTRVHKRVRSRLHSGNPVNRFHHQLESAEYADYKKSSDPF